MFFLQACRDDISHNVRRLLVRLSVVMLHVVVWFILFCISLYCGTSPAAQGSLFYTRQGEAALGKRDLIRSNLALSRQLYTGEVLDILCIGYFLFLFCVRDNVCGNGRG